MQRKRVNYLSSEIDNVISKCKNNGPNCLHWSKGVMHIEGEYKMLNEDLRECASIIEDKRRQVLYLEIKQHINENEIEKEQKDSDTKHNRLVQDYEL